MSESTLLGLFFFFFFFFFFFSFFLFFSPAPLPLSPLSPSPGPSASRRGRRRVLIKGELIRCRNYRRSTRPEEPEADVPRHPRVRRGKGAGYRRPRALHGPRLRPMRWCMPLRYCGNIIYSVLSPGGPSVMAVLMPH
jgi:hypothetical protein